ncbi:hypothetical protein GCM10009654_42640 [Streptomyces hebeiensis]|uniref:Uncharacterized protein n=1 Tax=Streptomyces hebeiensis TaxID=229486 RepID=A0ABN1UZ00_9ACTN
MQSTSVPHPFRTAAELLAARRDRTDQRCCRHHPRRTFYALNSTAAGKGADEDSRNDIVVVGLVQAPGIERNAIAAVNATNAARMAL